LQATIDDLRRRLDEEAAERREAGAEIRRLTLMLAHQPRADTPPALPDARAAVRPAVWMAAVAAVIAAAAAWPLWWPYWTGGD
jgi:ferric-dicitrate binding protein FerR (iron transport regulator)